MLRLSLLGPPDIRLQSKPIAFPTRKALALLIYLLVEGGMHPREHIMALLWPESPASRGRGVLRTTLSHLRRTLAAGTDQSTSSSNAYLISDGDLLGFDRDAPYELDLDTVDQALRAGRIDAYQAVVALDRGMFLAGFSLPDASGFDSWTTLQGEHWHQKLDRVYAELSRLYCDRHDTRAAIDIATRWVARDLLHESAHQRLIQAYLLAGDRDRALHAFNRCRTLLVEELGIEPAPATQALVAQIEKGQTLSRSGAPVIPPPAQPRQLPFAGRQSEFAQLAAYFQRIAGGEMAAAVIEGEAGIGKSRLADELLHWFMLQGADVIRGRAFEAGGRLPYQALTQALRRRIEVENAPDDLIGDVWLAELSRLLPELHERYPDLPMPDSDEETAHTRLVEAIVRLLQALATARPVVLFVDDLQWADGATLDLLQYMSQRLRAEPVALLLLLTLRSEDRATNVTLQNWLHALGRMAPLLSVHLDPLDASDTGQLVTALMQQMERASMGDEPNTAVNWLFHETAGQPFYLAETIGLLLEQGWLRDRAWKDIEPALNARIAQGRLIAPGIQDMLSAKLSRLSAGAAQLLTVAAVVGRPLPFETLRRIADVAEMTALAALDELRSGRLMIETAAPPPAYQVAHDKIRAVAYLAASPGRRHVLHRRALAQLELEHAAPAELAYHAGAAGMAEACFQYSVQAGEEALRLFALDVALEQFGQARTLLEQINVSIEPVAHLYMQMGRAYELQNSWQDARDVYALLAAQAQAAQAPHIEATALNRLGLVLGQGLYDLPQARHYLQTAQRIAQQSEHMTQLVESALNLAQISMYTWDAQTMVENGRTALEAARRLGLAETEARALNIMAYGFLASGAFSAMRETAQQAADLFMSQGNRALAADSLSLICCSATHGGHVHEAQSIGRQSWEMNLDLDNDWGIANASIFYAHALVEAGRLGEALTVAQLGRTRARAAGPQSLTALTANTLGDVHLALHAWESAQEAYAEALRIGDEVDHPFFIEWACAGLCAVHLAGHEVDAAAIYAGKAQTMRERVKGITAFAGLMRHAEVEALVQTGNQTAALSNAQRFASDLTDADSPRLRIVWKRIQAALALPAHGRDAIASLETALVLAQSLELPGEQWALHRQLAQVFAGVADAERAEMHRTEARTALHGLAASIDAEPWHSLLLAT